MEMVMPVNYVEMTDDEMMYVDGGGFVGVNINMNYKKWNSNNALVVKSINFFSQTLEFKS